GYSLTGDYDATARTGAVLFAPEVVRTSHCAPEGPCEHSAHLAEASHTFRMERIGNSAGQTSFNWASAGGGGDIPVGNFHEIEAVGDVNGDGVPDILDAHANGGDDGVAEDEARIRVLLGRRRPDLGPGVSNYGADPSLGSSLGPSRDMMRRSNWGDTTPTPALADMNGDGLADLVIVGPSNIEYWPGNGRGGFTACREGGCAASENGSESTSVHMVRPGPFAVASSPRGGPQTGTLPGPWA